MNKFREAVLDLPRLSKPSVSDRVELQLARATYQPVEDRAAVLQKANVQGYFWVNKPEFMAFEHQGKIYHVHRGSKTQEDWWVTDVALAKGELEKTERWKRAVQDVMDAQALSHLPVVQVGHSLGGTIAQQIAIRNNKPSVVFNMGSTPFQDYGSSNTEQHKHYRLEGDLISGFDSNAQTVTPAAVSSQNIWTVVARPNLTLPRLPYLVNATLQHSLRSF